MVPLFLIAAAFTACSGKDDSAIAVDPVEEACNERDNAGDTLVAPTDPQEGKKLPMGLGSPTTIDLPDRYASYIGFRLDQTTDLVVLAGTTAVIDSIYFNDAKMALPTSLPDSGCPDQIPETYSFDSVPAGQHILGFDVTTEPTLWVMLVAK